MIEKKSKQAIEIISHLFHFEPHGLKIEHCWEPRSISTHGAWSKPLRSSHIGLKSVESKPF